METIKKYWQGINSIAIIALIAWFSFQQLFQRSAPVEHINNAMVRIDSVRSEINQATAKMGVLYIQIEDLKGQVLNLKLKNQRAINQNNEIDVRYKPLSLDFKTKTDSVIFQLKAIMALQK